jgi:hypothetical protein
MPSFVETTLWLFVINLGIAFGAGIYEHRIVLPMWFERIPTAGSLRVNASMMRSTNSGIRFWSFVTTLPLTLLTLTSLALTWSQQTPRDEWWFIAAIITLVERIGTFSFFIPTAIKLMKSDELPQQKSAAMATRWLSFNYIREALTLMGWLAALKALSSPG